MRGVARTVGFLLRLSWRTDRRRLLIAFTLMMLGAAASPLVALCLRGLTDSALAGEGGRVTAFALAAGLFLTGELMLAHFAHLYYFELAELETEAVDAELIALTNGPAGMEHLDDPGFADTVALAREDSAQIQPSLEAVLQLAAAVLQVAATTFLLVMFAPLLALLPVFALVPVLAGRRAQDFVTRARESAADQIRLNRHLLGVATSPRHVHEIRLFRMGPHLVDRHATGWSAVTRALWRGHLASATLRGGAQLLFALAFGGALVLVGWQASQGRATAGDVVLVMVLALMIGTQLANALNLLVRVFSTGELVRRLETLRRLAGQRWDAGGTDAVEFDRLRDGVRLDGVGFTYPGAAAPVLRDVTLHLPAGGTVALVGENGAGKSTLAKLLCGLYLPTTGRITVDGVELREGPAITWRQRVAALFQDFAKIQLYLRESVGVGDPTADDGALADAIDRAQAAPVVSAVPGGLDGVVGVEYADGVELSGGQWQRLALARTFLRRHPLLVVLDEPAAALDASAEHELFARFARLSDASRRERGAVSVYISHRFSSVRMADLIVVLHDGQIVESGSHEELMAAGGSYAALFTMQAEAYR